MQRSSGTIKHTNAVTALTSSLIVATATARWDTPKQRIFRDRRDHLALPHR